MKKLFITIAFTLIVLSFSACDLIGGGWILPDYIGTWVVEQDGTTITYTFAREEWELLMQAEILGTICDIAANRGTMVNGGGKLTMTLTHEKVGDAVWSIIAPDTEWTEAAESDPLVIDWVVSGDKLTFSYSDDSEIIFTKVE